MQPEEQLACLALGGIQRFEIGHGSGPRQPVADTPNPFVEILDLARVGETDMASRGVAAEVVTGRQGDTGLFQHPAGEVHGVDFQAVGQTGVQVEGTARLYRDPEPEITQRRQQTIASPLKGSRRRVSRIARVAGSKAANAAC